MKMKMNILLADDDADDRMFFAMTLDELSIPALLHTVENGEELMRHLRKIELLPDLLFLDLNMPLKNGEECLVEIKQDKKLREIPVIIYSTSLHEDVADRLYKLGAHYYIRKANLAELKIALHELLTIFGKRSYPQPLREKFVVGYI